MHSLIQIDLARALTLEQPTAISEGQTLRQTRRSRLARRRRRLRASWRPASAFRLKRPAETL